MDRTRKLRRELSYGVARLRVLEKSVDPAQDDPSAKALATQIREQAGVCLDLLDQYQLSVPGRMWTYAETRCQPLRDDLKRTELQFRDASGEFKRRADKRTYSDVAFDWGWADVYEGQDLVAGGESDSEDEPVGTHERAPMVLSCRFIEAHNQQDLDGLIDLVDETVEFKTRLRPASDRQRSGPTAVRAGLGRPQGRGRPHRGDVRVGSKGRSRGPRRQWTTVRPALQRSVRPPLERRRTAGAPPAVRRRSDSGVGFLVGPVSGVSTR